MADDTEGIDSLLRRVRADIDELLIQLELGKKGAAEQLEEKKVELRSLLERAGHWCERQEDLSRDKVDDLRAGIDRLRVQLALGRMESRDRFREHRDQFHEAVDASRDAFESLDDDLRVAIDSACESLKTRVDALALDLGVGTQIAQDEWSHHKTALMEELRDLRNRVEPAVSGAQEAAQTAREEARSRYDGVKERLRAWLD